MSRVCNQLGEVATHERVMPIHYSYTPTSLEPENYYCIREWQYMFHPHGSRVGRDRNPVLLSCAVTGSHYHIMRDAQTVHTYNTTAVVVVFSVERHAVGFPTKRHRALVAPGRRRTGRLLEYRSVPVVFMCSILIL